jgi:hypothetical protein
MKRFLLEAGLALLAAGVTGLTIGVAPKQP